MALRPVPLIVMLDASVCGQREDLLAYRRAVGLGKILWMISVLQELIGMHRCLK